MIKPKIEYPIVTPKGKVINLIPIYNMIINEIENQMAIMIKMNKSESKLPCF